MIEARFEIDVPFPPDVVADQYFDIDHLEHVHPRTFGKGTVVTASPNYIVWDLQWPSVAGIKLRARYHQTYHAERGVHAIAKGGFAKGSESFVTLSPIEGGTRVQELHRLVLPTFPLVGKPVKAAIERNLAQIWKEDLAVGVCHGGLPGRGARAGKSSLQPAAEATIVHAATDDGWERISRSELPALGQSKRFLLRGVDVLISHTSCGYRATSSRFLHKGAPLELDAIDGGELVCPWHAWRYDLSDGSCRSSSSALRTFEVAEGEPSIRIRVRPAL